jgi:hypothetical protein
LACIELFLIFRGKTPPKNSPHSPKKESCVLFSCPQYDGAGEKPKKHCHLLFVLKK